VTDLSERPTFEHAHTILSALRGSHSHGTNIDPSVNPDFATDDIDVIDVVVLPPEFYLGLRTFGYDKGHKQVMQGEWDVIAREVRRFLALLRKGDPGAITILWQSDDSYLKITAAGQQLLDARVPLTLTKATIKSHMGYAMGQLKGMSKDPTLQAFKGEKRRALAQRFGYDTKHAAHTVRIMRMLIDLLETEQLFVDRTNIDVGDLIAIKCGEWTIEEVVAHVNELVEDARRLEPTVHWPDQPDERWLSSLCERVVCAGWREQL
jgi:predicted nucleotidyltransferase